MQVSVKKYHMHLLYLNFYVLEIREIGEARHFLFVTYLLIYDFNKMYFFY